MDRKYKEIFENFLLSLPGSIPVVGNIYSVFLSLTKDKQSEFLKFLEEMKYLNEKEFNTLKEELREIKIQISSKEEIEQATRSLNILMYSELNWRAILAFRLGMAITFGVIRMVRFYPFVASNNKFSLIVIETVQRFLLIINILCERLDIKLNTNRTADEIIDNEENLNKFINDINMRIEIGQAPLIKNLYMAGYNIGMAFLSYFFSILPPYESEFRKLINMAEQGIEQAENWLSKINSPSDFINPIRDELGKIAENIYFNKSRTRFQKIEDIEKVILDSIGELEKSLVLFLSK